MRTTALRDFFVVFKKIFIFVARKTDGNRYAYLMLRATGQKTNPLQKQTKKVYLCKIKFHIKEDELLRQN